MIKRVKYSPSLIFIVMFICLYLLGDYDLFTEKYFPK